MKLTTPTSIRLNPALYEKVKEDAFKEKRSISKQIEYILEKHYEKNAPADNQ